MARLKKHMIAAAGIGLLALALVYGFTCLGIYRGMRDLAGEASETYGGDSVTALMALLDDPNQGLPKRDRAVWALGQIGDDRALSVLKKYYTGEPCDHTRFLCQYELKKAIRKCRGNASLTSWVNALALRRPPER